MGSDSLICDFKESPPHDSFLCAQETVSGLLSAYRNGYNGRRVAITEIGKIAEKPCQALYSVFS